MSARVVLICHGSTSATRGTAFPLDEPLEPSGLAAALAMAERFPAGRATASCGPPLRCRQTAEALGLDAIEDAALADWDLGNWAGRSLIELAETDPQAVGSWTTDPAYTGHGGESLDAVIARIGAWLDGVAAPPPPVRVLAVVPPAVIRAAVTHALGAPSSSFWRIDVAPLAVVELRGQAGRWALYPRPEPLLHLA